MSFFGLSIAGSALDAFQTATDTASNDIANVNTPGASRQVVNFGPSAPVTGTIGYPVYSSPGTQGSGVTVTSIQRIHDDSYDSLFRGASSSSYFYQTEQQTLSGVQSAFGEPSAGVNTAFTNLQQAFSALSSNPTGASERQGVLTAAQTFVGALNTDGQALQGAMTSAQQQATTVVSQVNSLADEIAALNGQIRATSAVGGNANTYEDQRDEDIDKLSQLVPTQTSVLSNGSTLVTIGGRALVNDTTSYHLADPVVANDSSGNPQLVVGFADDPNPSSPNPVQAGSGQLGAYLDVYNNKLSPYLTNLNNFANAAANEMDRVTTAGYDQNGVQGTALFEPIVNSQAMSASNLQLGITNAAQIPAALASTAAGTLVQALNAGSNTVDPSAALLGSATLANPAGTVAAGGSATPGAPSGTLTIAVDGTTETFAYNMGAGGNADTIDDFVQNFNAAQLGVTASFDTTSQTIVFQRDPTNESLALRAAANPAASTTAAFTVTDSNTNVTGGTGTTSNSLLQVLGAGQINGVAQNGTNAFGSGDNSAVNAALTLFSANVGVPFIQATSSTAVVAGTTVTVVPTTGSLAGVTVGSVLTIGAGTAQQENVVVTAIDQATGSVTFTAAKAHAAGYNMTSAQSQTLGTAYSSLVSQMAYDLSTATTGQTTQASLASSIDSARQSVDGINLDEETQNLIVYQNSYQAAAKTMNVINTLLQTDISLIT